MTLSFQKIITYQPFNAFIRLSNYAVRADPWSNPHRRLLDYLLFFIQEGKCFVEVEGVRYDLREGDFCLIQPNQLCYMEGITRTITPYIHLDLFYNPYREDSFTTKPGQIDLSSHLHLLQPKLNDLEHIHIPVKFIPSDPLRFKETMLKTVGLWQNRDMISQIEAHHQAEELFISLLKDYGQLQQENKLSTPEQFNWITSYFSYHLSEPISLDDMAKRARLSPSRFCVLFKEKFGIPPHQFLMRMRVQHALELLRLKGHSMEEIAQFCGFNDVPHFSKTIKRLTGESPGTIRNRQK